MHGFSCLGCPFYGHLRSFFAWKTRSTFDVAVCQLYSGVRIFASRAVVPEKSVTKVESDKEHFLGK
jgi:hypothetical protein